MTFDEAAAFPPEYGPGLRMAGQMVQTLGQRLYVALGDEEAGLVGEQPLRKSAVPGGNHRQTCRLGFLKNQPLPFLVTVNTDAGQNEDMSSLTQRSESRAIQRPMQSHM